MNNIIYDAENMIGFSWDIAASIADDLKRGRIDDPEEMSISELLEELEQHNGLVICKWHPMGAWYVADLVEA